MLLAYGSPQLLIMSDHFPTETNMEKVMSATGESSALAIPPWVMVILTLLYQRV